MGANSTEINQAVRECEWLAPIPIPTQAFRSNWMNVVDQQVVKMLSRWTG